MILSGIKVMCMQRYSYLAIGVTKKNIDVNTHALGLGHGYNTIPHNFGCDSVSSGCAHVPRAVNDISPNR